MKLERLKTDLRRHEQKSWDKWLKCAAKLAGRFYDEVDGDDPFFYNETASVSLLTAAATQAGYLALAEFAARKQNALNRRRRTNGRADLWVYDSERSWAFEFKQITRGAITVELEQKMKGAVDCAKCVGPVGADHAVAGLIVTTGRQDDPADPGTLRILNNFASRCDLTWRMRSPLNAHTYFFFWFVS